MGPNILRGIEATFQGPITITSPMSSAPQPAVTWLDIVDYVNDNPLAYDIEIVPGRGRVCQLNLEGVEVEILEADWRLIRSGNLSNFARSSPDAFQTDQGFELATLDIVRDQLLAAADRASEVNARARQLVSRIDARQTTIRPAMLGISGRLPAPFDDPTYDVHAELLAQFSATESSAVPAPPHPSRDMSRGAAPRPPPPPPRTRSFQADYAATPYAPLILANLARLQRGMEVEPPCDRCRRLHVSCMKHQSACTGCTKKHTKCTWINVTDNELRKVQEAISMPNNLDWQGGRGRSDSGRGRGDSGRGGSDNGRGGSDSGRGGSDSGRGGSDSGRGGSDSGQAVARSARYDGTRAATASQPARGSSAEDTIPEAGGHNSDADNGLANLSRVASMATAVAEGRGEEDHGYWLSRHYKRTPSPKESPSP